MRWFQGTIARAVELSRSKHVILMVYIRGEDDMSKKMEETWADDRVADICKSSGFITLLLQANSDIAAQFCQIYPIVCVPCTYFIGENGVPLEVVGGHVEAEELSKKIDNVLQMHRNQLLGEAPVSDTTTQSSNRVPEKTETATSESVTSKPESTESTSSKPDSAEPKDVQPLEDRVAKVNELINKKREERMKAEQEKEIQREKERIEMGREMAKLKNWKAEKEAQELREQMKKDKLEEKLARQRVKEQIAKDRADRAARYHKEKEEQEQIKKPKREDKATVSQEEQERLQKIRRESASIQFRLPDGSRITNQFQSSQTLGEAREFLLERVRSTMPSVRFCGTYPKRDFTEADMSQTLLDLGLAPSAALIVLPGGARTVAPRSGGDESGGFIWMLLGPLLALWNYIYSFLFGSATRSQDRPAPAPSTSTQPTPSQTYGGARPKSSYGVRSRKEGNMHRLTADDEDDESATWNGNSTQQM